MDAQNQHLVRIKRVTENFFFWQGLRLVPLGVVILLFASRFEPWWPLQGLWGDAVLVAATVATYLLSRYIGHYYRRVFGSVAEDLAAHSRRDSLKWSLVYPVMVASIILDLVFRPLFFITGPVWAVAIVAYWWSTGRGRPHYLVAAFVMAALGFLPWLGFAAPGKSMFGVFGIVLGLTYIVGGLLDHLELRQLLPPVNE